MKTKILQNTKVIILGLIVTLGMGYAGAQTFSGPTCSPTSIPGCNTPAPINASSSPQIKTGSLTVGGLGIVGNFTFLPSAGATVTDGSVLMADGTTGKIKWGVGYDAASAVTAVLSSIKWKSILSYGEGYSLSNGVGYGKVRLIQNNVLTIGKKYAFIFTTSGYGQKTQALANGIDGTQSVQIRCGDGSSFTDSPMILLKDLPASVLGQTIVSYQGTMVYNPTVTNTATAHTSWGSIPYTAGSGVVPSPSFKYQDIADASAGCTDGRGTYNIYIYEYDTLKTYMDLLYQATGSSKFKFNDPSSADASLHNGSVWATY